MSKIYRPLASTLPMRLTRKGTSGFRKEKMMTTIKDERFMTLVELAQLAREIPTLQVGTRKYKRARNMIAVASAILKDALPHLLRWAFSVYFRPLLSAGAIS